MSQWGVFREDTGEFHIAPVLADGRLALRHALQIEGVIFSIDGIEFRCQTMEGAIAFILELAKRKEVPPSA